MAIKILHIQKKVNYQLMHIPVACLFTRVYLYRHVNMRYLFKYLKTPRQKWMCNSTFEASPPPPPRAAPPGVSNFVQSSCRSPYASHLWVCRGLWSWKIPRNDSTGPFLLKVWNFIVGSNPCIEPPVEGVRNCFPRSRAEENPAPSTAIFWRCILHLGVPGSWQMDANG